MVFGWNKKEFTKADHRGQEDARKEDGVVAKMEIKLIMTLT